MRFFFGKIIIFFLFLSCAEASNNLRFVDINYIVNNSNVGKSLNQLIKSKNNTVTQELNKIKKTLNKKKEKIITQKNILKEDEFNKLVIDYENDVKKFDDLRKNKTNDFNNFRINSKKKILNALNPLMTNFLEKQSISILLQKDNVLFGNKELDITKEILKIFDDKHKTMKFE